MKIIRQLICPCFQNCLNVFKPSKLDGKINVAGVILKRSYGNWPENQVESLRVREEGTSAPPKSAPEYKIILRF